MRETTLILTFIIAGLFVASASADEIANPWAPLTKTLEAEYPANGPGAYAIVAQGDHILFSHGFGLAELEHNIPFTETSVVRIASLTKQFTAIAVLRLVQEHKLHLDVRLERLLPDCPIAWRPITIRELLDQTTGLSDDLSPLYKNITTDLTVDQILALYKDRPLDWMPGMKWRYSNLNYWILGKIIETVSRESYAEFVSKHVLTKDMTSTRYGSHDVIIPGRAHGYETDPKMGWVNARYFSPTLGYAAGGFLSTPAEMAHWYAALGRGAIIPPKLLMLALTEEKTTDGKPTGYGLGWYVSEQEGLKIAHHGGSTLGFQSSVYWIPSCGLFVGVFKNTNDERGEPDADARALLNVTLAGCSAVKSHTPNVSSKE